MRISDDIKKQIPDLYNKLGTKTAVAKQLHISYATVAKYLQGIQNPEKNEKRKGEDLSNEEIKEINRLYKNNLSAAKIAKQFNTTAAVIYSKLDKENLEKKELKYKTRDALYYYIIKLFGIDSPEYPVSKHNITLMSRFYKQGISYSEQYLTLQYYYDITHHQVKNEYKTIGIIPYVYQQAKTYYLTQEKKKEQLQKDILTQLEKDQKEITVDIHKKNRRKKKINIEELVANDTD